MTRCSVGSGLCALLAATVLLLFLPGTEAAQCSPWVIGCKDCVDETLQCNYCPPGWTHYYDRKGCIQCPDFCERCEATLVSGTSQTTTCTKCFSGYLLDGEKCYQCSIGCNECLKEGKCESSNCTSGYRFDSTKRVCEACQVLFCSNCDTNGAGLCDSGHCAKGTYFNTVTKLCTACTGFCHECTTATDCKQCFTGYVFNSVSKNCEQCSGACDNCDSRGAGKCDDNKCHKYHALNGVSHTCQSCSPNCESCDSSGPGKCDACKMNFALNIATRLCLACPENCKVCKVNANGVSTTCTECHVEHRLKSRNTCDYCPDFCDTCALSTYWPMCTLNGCKTGYATNPSTGTCHKCPDNCAACSYVGTGTQCLSGSCAAGFARRGSDGLCYACPDKCSQCTDDGTKTRCTWNFCAVKTVLYLKEGTCKACPPNCDYCRADLGGTVYCLQCANEYAMSINLQTCIACPPNCKRCWGDASKTYCFGDQCHIGYAYRSTDSTCQACTDTGCLNCTMTANVPTCTGTCKDKFVWNGASCAGCGTSCDACTFTNNQVQCTKCASGTVLNGGSCHACSVCGACTWSASGTVCNTGTCSSTAELSENMCIQYPKGCVSGTLTGGTWTCNTCETGYTVALGRCLKCPDGCSSCTYSASTATTLCTTCSSTYVKIASSSTCSACARTPALCTVCVTGGAGKCDAGGCPSKYYYSNGACIACTNGCLQCTASGCNTCDSKFVPTSTTCSACASPNCQSCTVAGQCQVCDPGYVPNTGSTACMACSSNGLCRHCSYSNSNNQAICDFGGCVAWAAMAPDRTCVACPDGCAKCWYDPATSATKCLSGHCKEKYAQDSSTLACTKCPANCNHCYLANGVVKCTPHGCKDRYVQSSTGTSCLACHANCKRCDTRTVQLECDPDQCDPEFAHDPADNTCKACGQHCLSCTGNIGGCSSGGCKTNYDYVAGGSGSCTPHCAANCQACTIPLECDTCNTNYRRDGTQCRLTSTFCHTHCQGNTATDCSAYGKCNAGRCADGYSWNFDTEECDACSQNCMTSSGCKNAGPGACEAWGCDATHKRMYTLALKNCQQRTCSGACEYCDTDGTCFSSFYCPDGSTMVGTACNTCTDPNCKFCIGSPGTCQQCNKGYALITPAGTCTACATSNCAVCTSYLGTTADVSCKACDEGYRLNGANCEQCTVTNCGVCEPNVGTCLKCKAQHYGTGTAGALTACTPCASAGCDQCVLTDANTCDLCKVGWSKQGTSCTQCPANCDVCDTNTAHCERCAPYYTVVNNACQKCAEGCSKCDQNGAGDCDVCGEGRFWDRALEACITCAKHCLSCTVKDQCGTCKPGFKMDGNICKPCGPNCLTCSTVGSCDASGCADGFTDDSNVCKACSVHCWKCSAADACDDAKCIAGIKSTAGPNFFCTLACTNPLCTACESTTPANCPACIDFFGLQGGAACLACGVHCKACVAAAACDGTSCDDGWYDDTGCKLCNLNNVITSQQYTGKWGKCTSAANNVNCAGITDVWGTTIYRNDGGVCNAACAKGCSGCGTKDLCDGGPPDPQCEPTKFHVSGTGATRTCALNINGCNNCRAGHCTNHASDVCADGKCTAGFGQTAAKACVTCHTHCQPGECVTASKCNIDKCNDDYTTKTSAAAAKAAGDCQACAPNCKKCNENGQSKCDTDGCKVGFAYDSATMTCKTIHCTAPANPQIKPNTGCQTAPVTGCRHAHYTSRTNTWYCPEGFCETGYYWETNAAGGTCTSCATNCGSCVTTNTCLKSGCTQYFDDTTSGTCEACPVGCGVCSWMTSKTVCTTGQCKSQYYEEVTNTIYPACLACPRECTDCSLDTTNGDSLKCTGCNSGFVLDDNICVPCPPNCAQCTYSQPKTTCTTCNSEYILNPTDSTCLACPNNCLSCTANQANGAVTSVCEVGKCKPKHAQNPTTFDCLACPTNCEYCSYDASVQTLNTKCDWGGCEANHYQHTDRKCCACGNGCSHCTTDGNCNNVQCLPHQCKTGYGYWIKDHRCYDCGTGCATCSASGTGSTPTKVCLTCLSATGTGTGYIMNAATCHKCPDKCLICSYNAVSQKTVCTTCSNLYVKKDDSIGSCVACPDQCTACTWHTGTQTVRCNTASCNDGYALETNTYTCAACSPDCIRCPVAGSGKCDLCKARYRLSTTNLCEACDPNCNTCQTAAAGKCDASGCVSRYAINTNTANCEQCDLHCKQCLTAGPGNCDLNQCDALYAYRADTKKCVACPSKCTECTWSTTPAATICTLSKCSSGYGLLANGSCGACPRDCDTCILTNGFLICATCKTGYIVNSRDCGRCPRFTKKCIEIFGTMVTETCLESYVKNSTQRCEKCPNHCKTCEYSGATVKCTSCVPGPYNYTANDLCQDCPTLTGVANCNKCTRASSTETPVCQSCDSGFTLSQDYKSCYSCSPLPNCGISCYDPPQQCATCKPGYLRTQNWDGCGMKCFIGVGSDTTRDSPAAVCASCAAKGSFGANNFEWQQRGCLPFPCLWDGQECITDSATGIEHCGMCCDGPLCNKKLIKPRGASGGASAVRPLTEMTIGLLLTPLLLLQ